MFSKIKKFAEEKWPFYDLEAERKAKEVAELTDVEQNFIDDLKRDFKGLDEFLNQALQNLTNQKREGERLWSELEDKYNLGKNIYAKPNKSELKRAKDDKTVAKMNKEETKRMTDITYKKNAAKELVNWCNEQLKELQEKEYEFWDMVYDYHGLNSEYRHYIKDGKIYQGEEK